MEGAQGSTASIQLFCVAAVVLFTTGTPRVDSLRATEFFVSQLGSNTNSGTEEDPWQDVQTGLDRVSVGDTLVILPGTYQESLTTSTDGLPNAPITVRAEAPGTVTIVPTSGRLLDIRHANWTFDGIRFNGRFNDADIIRVRSTADGLTLREIDVFDGSRDGIDLGSNSTSPPGPDFDFLENVVIENSTLWNLLWMDASGQRQDAHGIVAGGVRDLVVRDTQISFVSGDALQLQDGGWDRVLVDQVKFWNGPLAQTVGGFDQGINPGENAIDTKQDQEILLRGRLTVNHSEFFGWSGDLITNASALNLKESIEAVVDGNTFYDNEISLRLRGRSEDSGAHVSTMNNVFFDNETVLRYEEDINQLYVFNNTFGDGNGQFFKDGGEEASGRTFRPATTSF